MRENSLKIDLKFKNRHERVTTAKYHAELKIRLQREGSDKKI